LNVSTGGYSYTLIQDERRVMGWDNAPHHPRISTAPHHFHTPEGTILASPLTGNPARDIVCVARAIDHYLETDMPWSQSVEKITSCD